MYNFGVDNIVKIQDILFIRHPRFFSLGYYWTRKLIFWISVRVAYRLLTVSDQSKNNIQQFLKPAKDVLIIPNAPNSIISSEEILPTSVLEYVGKNSYYLKVGLSPEKNYGLLVECFQKTRIWEFGGKLVIVSFCSQEFKLKINKIKSKKVVVWIDQASDGILK
jgi:hypothetical protein